jgi:hypothetical protein
MGRALPVPARDGLRLRLDPVHGLNELSPTVWRIVSKKLTSRYKSGACKSWLKVKNPAYERR